MHRSEDVSGIMGGKTSATTGGMKRQDWRWLAVVAPIALALLLMAGGHLVKMPEIDPMLSLPPVAV